MGELYDAPNQQVVRADGSGPWEEGTGGTPHPEQRPQQAQQQQEERQPEPEPKAQKSGRRRSGSSDVDPAKD